MYSPKTSATNFVHELCTCRAKENLAPLLQLVTSTFDVFSVWSWCLHFAVVYFCSSVAILLCQAWPVAVMSVICFSQCALFVHGTHRATEMHGILHER